jgi:predicted DNA-binding protein (MmcQ/YjbR family)
MSARTRKALDDLRRFALGLPGAFEDNPWGHEPVVKVGKKIFVFLGAEDAPGMTVKLPDSADQALELPGAEPSGYGLGRHGWVTVPIGAKGAPRGVAEDWVEESYRAIAPKKLVAELDARSTTGPT